MISVCDMHSNPGCAGCSSVASWETQRRALHAVIPIKGRISGARYICSNYADLLCMVGSMRCYLKQGQFSSQKNAKEY